MTLLEVCVDSPAGFQAAVDGGADRIELCAALGVGGLTPSPGLIALAAASPCPSRAMTRARIGDYVYSQAEIDVMRRDIDAFRAAGLAGAVIGANLATGGLDEKTLALLAGHAKGLQITLNRCVDLSPDPLGAVDIAIGLGIDTILTSGGSLKAPDGAEAIAAMVRRADGRVEILGGSGLSPGNVLSFIEKTGVPAVHGSFSAPWPGGIEDRLVRFGYLPKDARETDQATVRRMKELLSA